MAETTSKGLGVSAIDLDSLGEVQSAINYLDAAIEKINDVHDSIGSLQNRLKFASSNLPNSMQNSAACMSTCGPSTNPTICTDSWTSESTAS